MVESDPWPNVSSVVSERAALWEGADSQERAVKAESPVNRV